MKFSTFLGCAALLVSVGAYAQTSQTFNFGEGQTTPHAANARPSQHKTKPKHQAAHQKRQPPQASNVNLYSRG